MTEETIYVALLGEGLDVWRPVKARRLSRDRYLILDQDYHPYVETWAYEPGTVVECRRESRDGRELVIALGAAESNSSKSGSQEKVGR